MTRNADSFPEEKRRRCKAAASSRVPSKKELQAQFLRQCEADGLAAQQAMARASAFPAVPADKIRILYCPEF